MVARNSDLNWGALHECNQRSGTLSAPAIAFQRTIGRFVLLCLHGADRGWRSELNDDDNQPIAPQDFREPEDVGGALTASLYQWAADARIDELSQAKSREHWLRQQLAEDTTFSGVLVDLAEQAQPVVITTAAANDHSGVVVTVGADFLVLQDELATEVLIRRAAIVGVRTVGQATTSLGSRTATVDMYFNEALSALAENQPRVIVATTGSNPAVVGDLHIVGQDVVTLNTASQTMALTYIPTASITEISVASP